MELNMGALVYPVRRIGRETMTSKGSGYIASVKMSPRFTLALFTDTLYHMKCEGNKNLHILFPGTGVNGLPHPQYSLDVLFKSRFSSLCLSQNISIIYAIVFTIIVIYNLVIVFTY